MDRVSSRLFFCLLRNRNAMLSGRASRPERSSLARNGGGGDVWGGGLGPGPRRCYLDGGDMQAGVGVGVREMRPGTGGRCRRRCTSRECALLFCPCFAVVTLLLVNGPRVSPAASPVLLSARPARLACTPSLPLAQRLHCSYT